MISRITTLAAVSVAAVVCWPGPGHMARAETGRDIPQSVRVEHESILTYLRRIAAKPTPEGAAAQNVIDLLLPHMAREEAYILPSLGLLPVLVTGKVTADMRWAIVSADRVKAEQGILQKTHDELSDAFIALLDAAETEGDEVTVAFAKDLAADDLGDREVTEPTTILIGEFVRGHLPPE